MEDEPASVVARRPKDRADQIVAAAARLFAERGYHVVGIDDIGEAVGISGPAVYRHFESKQALLVATFARFLDEMEGRYREAVAAAKTAAERLRLVVRTTIAGAIEGRDLFAVYHREMRSLIGVYRDKNRENERIWTGSVLAVRPDLSEREALFIGRVVAILANSVIIHYPSVLSRARLDELLGGVALAAVLARPQPEGVAPSSESFATAVRQSPLWGQKRVIRRTSRREAILAAAVRLVRSHGYSGLSVGDIAGAAGIAGSGIYRYFRNKEDVLAALVNRAAEQFALAVSRSLATSANASQALERLVSSHVELAANHPDLVAVYWAEAHELSPAAQLALGEERRDQAADWVAVLREARPSLAEEEARTIVHATMGVVCAPAFVDVRLPSARATRIVAAMAMAILLNSLRGE